MNKYYLDLNFNVFTNLGISFDKLKPYKLIINDKLTPSLGCITRNPIVTHLPPIQIPTPSSGLEFKLSCLASGNGIIDIIMVTESVRRPIAQIYVNGVNKVHLHTVIGVPTKFIIVRFNINPKDVIKLFIYELKVTK